MDTQSLLAQLNDIQLPEPIGWWPPAPGWWLLLFITLVLLIVIIWWLKKPKANAVYKQAESERQQIAHAYQKNKNKLATVKALSTLIRRISISHRGRQQTAGVAGYAWLLELDEMFNADTFSRGIGKVLAEAPYMTEAQLDDYLNEQQVDIESLLTLSQQFIQRLSAQRKKRKKRGGQ